MLIAKTAESEYISASSWLLHGPIDSSVMPTKVEVCPIRVRWHRAPGSPCAVPLHGHFLAKALQLLEWRGLGCLCSGWGCGVFYGTRPVGGSKALRVQRT